MNKWTILFYANGNNELEPDIWKAFLKLKNMKLSKYIEIIVQISRQSEEITKIIRPNFIYPDFDEKWSGCKRYVINENGCTLVEELNSINMASPLTLKDFIIWSQQNYQSEKYMLILGGHVYQFIGMSPDFTVDKPYIMGFRELTEGIQQALESLNSKIDILLMDTCYVSTFETLCEFGKYKNPRVHSILTYIGGGPIAGFPYDNMIEIMEKEIINKTYDGKEIINKVIDNIVEYNFILPLIGLKIDHRLLEMCKEQFSKIAISYLFNKDKFKNITTPYEILNCQDNTYPWISNVNHIHKLSTNLIIDKSKPPYYDNKNLPIHLLYKKIPDEERKRLYEKLYFSTNNLWLNVICDNKKVNMTYEKPKLLPMEMTPIILQAFISNANKQLPLTEQIKIKLELVKYCNWSD